MICGEIKYFNVYICDLKILSFDLKPNKQKTIFRCKKYFKQICVKQHFKDKNLEVFCV